ncbi:SEC-C domain-containing protein [Sutcliffiella horikoshii]|uniref:YecA family protein n=1 Tax=Sutcliffiella horikoshii TaxID=79883 RepID=UPI00384F7331
MQAMPAICNTCETIFPSGFYGEDSIAFFSGATSGPCPKCGGMGRIPDGEFTFFNNIIRILSAPNRTIQELETLANILQNTQYNIDTTPEVAINKISEEIPQLSSISDFLKNIDYKFWVSIILSTIYFLLPLLLNKTDDDKVEPNIEYNVVINHVYNTNIEVTNLINQYNNSPKIGRNEPCYCGSEIKYKRCHGR